MQHLLSAVPSTKMLDGPLSEPGIVALRDALRAYTHGRPVDSRLRQSVRLLCDHARQRDQRVEHLLVALKQTWWSLPEMQRVSRDALGARMLLNRTVSMCIEQFYATERDT